MLTCSQLVELDVRGSQDIEFVVSVFIHVCELRDGTLGLLSSPDHPGDLFEVPARHGIDTGSRWLDCFYLDRTSSSAREAAVDEVEPIPKKDGIDVVLATLPLHLVTKRWAHTSRLTYHSIGHREL